uniref:Uncharacterized protein n=1 Tax=Vitis vinifera TaxID=29760 RepID=F6HK31_VITVI
MTMMRSLMHTSISPNCNAESDEVKLRF